jgi:hypothetical protein
MNTSKQLTETQRKALDIVQKLVEDKKIDFADALTLIISIYENEKEYVYIPYQNPWVTEPYKPWTTEPYRDETPWERNTIMCGDNATNATADPNRPDPYTYAINATVSDAVDWWKNYLRG